MRHRILSFLINHGTLVQPEAVDYILSKKEPIPYVQGILNDIEEPPFILTVAHLQKVEKIARRAASSQQKTAEKKSEIKPIMLPSTESVKPKDLFTPDEKPLDDFTEEKLIRTKPDIVCHVRKLPEEVKIIYDITGNSTCQGKIGDFKLYFNNRLKTLRRLLKEKRQMVGLRDLAKVNRVDGSFKIVGMVSDIRMTKKGNKMITLEDETSSQSVLLTKDNRLVNDSTVLDEIIGVIGTNNRNRSYMLAEEVVRPDIPVNRTPNRCHENIYAAFVSDIHVGSNTFLEDEFRGFLNWLKGNNGRKRDVAEKLRYIVVPGDIVDGIGIYPGQEEELLINDIYRQYEEVARLFADVPKHIKVIMLPGNHDAVRPAEPQPTFPEEIRKLFPPNVIFVGNPCYFSLHGVEILAYHGRSMDDFIKALPSLDYSKAIPIMIEMLKKRHLAPIYGGKNPIAPEHKDYLVIDRVPDIFVTGHGHSTGMREYRGVTLINASAWQSQTSYQEMHNFTPDPAKVPLINLHTGEASIMDFS